MAPRSSGHSGGQEHAAAAAAQPVSRRLSLHEGQVVALLPRVLLPRLLRLQQKADWEAHEGALLFVDVAGFSAVASRLKKLQNYGEGAETLSFHLNGYFSRIIDVVLECGGDIVFFSGDALMVAWTAGRVQSCAACLQCGAALLKEASEYSFTLGEGGDTATCTMQLHIGGASGTFSGMFVGGQGSSRLGQWKYLVTGLPVEMAGVAATAATNGQFVVTADVLVGAADGGARVSTLVVPPAEAHESLARVDGLQLHLFQEFDDKEWADRHKEGLRAAVIPPALTPEAMKVAERYVFDTVVKASETGQLCGALRNVCTVFIKLTSVNCRLPPNELHGQINGAVCTIQQQLAHFGGILNKVMMDDKGVICLCLFGVPLHGHEDDAYRAIVFAMRCGRKVQKLNKIVLSIGISRAVVFCGITGSQRRNEYTVLGDGVNLAARLMCQAAEFCPAKPHVMIDHTTEVSKGVDAIASFGYCMVPGDPLLLKGQENLVRCVHVSRAADCDALFNDDDDDPASPTRSSSESSIGSAGAISRHSHISRHSITSAGSEGYLGTLKNKSATSQLLMNAKRNLVIDSCGTGLDGAAGDAVAGVPRSPRTARSDGSSSSDSTCSPREYGRSSPVGGRSRASSVKSSSSKRHKAKKKKRGSPSNFGLAVDLAGVERGLSSGDDDSAILALEGLEASVPLIHSLPTGRDGELKAINDRVTTWMSGTSVCQRCVVLAGESQIGKTHLIQAIEHSMEAEPAKCLVFRCVEAQMDSQYGALRRMLQKTLADTTASALLEDVPDSVKELLPLLNLVMRSDVHKPSHEVMKKKPEEKLRLTNKLVHALIKARWGNRLFLMVDDLQWLDDATANYLADAFADADVFMLCGIRKELLTPISRDVDTVYSKASLLSLDSDEPFTVALSDEGTGQARLSSEMLASQLTATILLSPLSYDSTFQLIKESKQYSDVDQRLAQIIFSKSDGLPGYAIEMVNALLSSQLISRNMAGRLVPHIDCDIEQTLAQFVPASMEASVMAIIDRFTPRDKKVASVAAVLGRSSPFPLLIDCLAAEGLSRTEAIESLDNLKLSGLLGLSDTKKRTRGTVPLKVRTGDSLRSPRAKLVKRGSSQSITTLIRSAEGELRVLFSRSTIADVIYNTILTRERRRLHSLAGRVIVLSQKSPIMRFLVWHYRMSEDLSSGWRFIELFFQTHLQSGNYPECLRLLAELLAFCDANLENRPDAIKPAATQDDVRGQMMGLPSAFNRSEWVLFTSLCLYETGHINAAQVHAQKVASAPPNPEPTEVYFDQTEYFNSVRRQLNEGRRAGSELSATALHQERLKGSRPGSEQSLTRMLSNTSSMNDSLLSFPSSHAPNEGAAGSGRRVASHQRPSDADRPRTKGAKPAPEDSAKARKKKKAAGKTKAGQGWACCCGAGADEESGEDPASSPQAQKYSPSPTPSKPKEKKEKKEKKERRKSNGDRAVPGPTNAWESPRDTLEAPAGVRRTSQIVMDKGNDGALVWAQLSMLACEISFFQTHSTFEKLWTDMKACTEMYFPIDAAQHGLDLMRGTAATDTLPDCGLYESPFMIMGLATLPKGLGLLKVAESELTLASSELSLLPLHAEGLATTCPVRPSCVGALLMTRAVVKMFAGDAKGVWDDCIRLKNHRLCDERWTMYACIIRSHAAAWYNDRSFSKLEAAWKRLTPSDVKRALDRGVEDTILSLLFSARDAEHFGLEEGLREVSLFVTPFHILAAVSLLDDSSSLAADVTERLLRLVEASAYPFARLPYLYFSGVLGDNRAQFAACVREALSKRAAGSPLQVFTFRSAARLVSMEEGSLAIRVDPLVRELLAAHTGADEVAPGGKAAAAALLELGKDTFQLLPEHEHLERLLCGVNSAFTPFSQERASSVESPQLPPVVSPRS
eukprot:Rhum_TRINITY_DN14800_c19_g1::Rhum_TRINITY_DN14800_c19_g1_i1::g.121380::m.121380